MSVTVCRPAAQFCTSCYTDHDGQCPSDRSTVRTLDASTDGVTVVAAASGNVPSTEEDNTPMTTDPKTASHVDAPATDVISSCPAPAETQAEDPAVAAVRGAVESATAPLKAELATAKDDADYFKRLAADRLTRNRRLEGDLSHAAGLLIEGLGHIGNLTQDVAELENENAVLGAACTVARHVIAEQTAENAALTKALTAAHAFARKAYSDPSTPRALKGEAAIAIVEISDAVTGLQF